MNNISEMIIAFGRSNRGVEYQSLDAQPVHLFFLLITPDDKPGDYLKTLARVSRILNNPVLRDGLLKASQRRELQRLIFEEDGKYPQPQPLPQK
jgi:PTS system nitrogen regulatory IIA component